MAEPRKALSNLIQGGVAEIMRHALIRLNRSIKDGTLHDVRILLQVHDQIIFEVPNRHLDSCVTKIKTAMEDFKWLRSPFRVDVSVGDRWSDLKKWTPTEIRRKR
jgi:DNA polymerase-1